MAAKKKPVVYLAGPISGCNPEQRTKWRRLVRDHWGGEFEFIDPAESGRLVSEEGSAHEIIRREEEDLRKVDAVLANMWKESIGTAIVVSRARAKAMPVVAVDPNHLKSRVLAYYADAVATTADDGMKQLRTILRARSRLTTVIKRGGREEPFRRDKLARSIRAACQDAGQSDVLAPAAILPQALTLLVEGKHAAPGKVTTRAIKDAVWRALAELESDPIRHADFTGIREAWELYAAGRRSDRVRETSEAAAPVHARALKVEVFSLRSHTTIWGRAVKKLADIPLPARTLFQEICRVEGIAEIRLTRMGTAPKAPGVRAEILASRTPGILEGKCFNTGVRGEVQMFQVRVHDVGRTEAIREQLVTHLSGQRLLKLGPMEAAA